MLNPRGNEGERTLALQIMADGLGRFHQEFVFSSRKYRLDIAFVKEKVGIEIEGAIFAKGAHSRPLGIIRDMSKHNLLVLLGWRVLRYTPTQVNNGEAIEGLKTLLTAVRLNLETFKESQGLGGLTGPGTR